MEACRLEHLCSDEMQRLRQLEDENCKLKQMFAELSLDYKILKDVVEKKL